MKSKIENGPKRTYVKPLIERMILDNEISLILESDPPGGPFELTSTTHDQSAYDPFKNTQA